MEAFSSIFASAIANINYFTCRNECHFSLETTFQNECDKCQRVFTID